MNNTEKIDLRILGLKIVVLVAIIVGLWYVVTSIITLNTPDALPTEFEANARNLGISEAESRAVYANVRNIDELYRLLPSLYIPIINQIYSEHYKQTGNLERDAEFVGQIDRSSRNYKFSTKFLPSGDVMDTEVTVIDRDRQLYNLTTRKIVNE